MSSEEFEEQIEEWEKDDLYVRLQNRYLFHREKLLTFLCYPGLPPTNNES